MSDDLADTARHSTVSGGEMVGARLDTMATDTPDAEERGGNAGACRAAGERREPASHTVRMSAPALEDRPTDVLHYVACAGSSARTSMVHGLRAPPLVRVKVKFTVTFTVYVRTNPLHAAFFDRDFDLDSNKQSARRVRRRPTLFSSLE